MKLKYLQLAVVAAALALAGPALAEQGKSKKKKQQAPAAEVTSAPHGKFSDQERSEIKGYFSANPSARSQLPPGLAKKNKIPPGWQKKLAVGQRFPDDAWEHRVPLPQEIESKLPRIEKGEIRVRVDDRVVRVAEKTREVLDIIELAREVSRSSPPR